MARNLQVTLVSRPVGEPQESDFAVVEGVPTEPGEGEALVRNLWLSLDPYRRGRMNEARSYARHVELGEVMTAQGVGEIVEIGPHIGIGLVPARQIGRREEGGDAADRRPARRRRAC